MYDLDATIRQPKTENHSMECGGKFADYNGARPI